MIYLSFFIAALFQTSVFSLIPFFGVIPNLVLVLMIWRLHEESDNRTEIISPARYILLVVIAGILLDLFSGVKIGVNALPLLVTILIIKGTTSKVIKSDNRLIFLLLLIFSTFFFSVSRLIVSLVLLEGTFAGLFDAISYYTLHVFILESMYNIIIFIAIILFNQIKTRKKRIALLN